MREITGDMWLLRLQLKANICITTNGSLKNDGCGVMGAGCALEARKAFPHLPKILGDKISSLGNRVHWLLPNILSFPVKHEWFEKADISLIQRSAEDLSKIAKEYPRYIFILPRPGCGNGRLSWEEVKPVLANLPDNIWVITK